MANCYTTLHTCIDICDYLFCIYLYIHSRKVPPVGAAAVAVALLDGTQRMYFQTRCHGNDYGLRMHVLQDWLMGEFIDGDATFILFNKTCRTEDCST